MLLEKKTLFLYEYDHDQRIILYYSDTRGVLDQSTIPQSKLPLSSSCRIIQCNFKLIIKIQSNTLLLRLI